MIKDLDRRLESIACDNEEAIVDGERFWLVVINGDGFLAAWVDEEGDVQKRVYKSAAGAVRKASESWGR